MTADIFPWFVWLILAGIAWWACGYIHARDTYDDHMFSRRFTFTASVLCAIIGIVRLLAWAWGAR